MPVPTALSPLVSCHLSAVNSPVEAQSALRGLLAVCAVTEADLIKKSMTIQQLGGTTKL